MATVSQIVHELRSPLSVITGYAALLREQALSAPSTDFVEAIANSARDLERKLADLVDGNGGQPAAGETHAGESHLPADGAGTRSAVEVLCIEDDRGTATLVEHVLNGHDGISVVAVADGAGGLARARDHAPDLILLDLNIDGMSGEEVLRRVRADARTCAVPVLVLSGAITEERSVSLLGAGADAVIAKPFLPDELRGVVRDVLDGATARHDALDPRYLDAFDELEDAVGLVATMLGDAQENMRALRAAVAAGERQEAAGRAHALRGGMSNLGAHVVSRESLELESAAQDGDDAALPAILVRLESAMEHAEAALHRRVPSLRDHR